MQTFETAAIALKNGESTYYYEGGTKNGIPLIFLHGWPAIAETWKRQLAHFTSGSSGLEYRVIAPDMRGYGLSSSPGDKRGYSLEVLVNEIVDSLASHHPELCLGVALICVPYRTLELGLDYTLTLLNRDIYPEEEYEYGQFEYMKYYEMYPSASVKSFERCFGNVVKAIFNRHDPSKYGKPSDATSMQLREGGWFGGHPEAVPDIPLEHTVLDDSLYQNLLKSHEKHGPFPMSAYYLNHGANAEYAKSEKNGGVLEMSVLYIDAKHDAVCSASTTPKMGDSQKAAVKDLTYVTIEADHWVQLEKASEVNKALETWLNRSLQFRC
ncbi:Alpha/Beta hydrolase protein [Leptodontidium sp. MPI-SDFR-AT-0119]|nr:Alpha/Beta hydrolase protein [Leptodontidium sp. MPI-SDFR-AT-0119]